MKMEGKTENCLNHYLSQLPWGSKGCTEARQSLADFVGVSLQTIRRWLVGDGLPIGFVLVKLRYFLESQGYKVLELEMLNNTVRDLGKLIAHGVIESEEASKEIGFSDGRHFTEVLHGHRGLSVERMAIAEKICSTNRGKLDKLPKPKISAQSAIATNAPTMAKPSYSVPDTSAETLCLLNTLEGLVTLLTPRLEHMLSDGFTAEKRQQFRQRAGDNLIFHLANRFFGLNKLLNALCSEKAREINSVQTQRK